MLSGWATPDLATTGIEMRVEFNSNTYGCAKGCETTMFLFCFVLFFPSLFISVYKKKNVLKRVQARVGSDYLRRQILKRHGWHLRFVAK